jgi:hypothetical protein
MSNSKTISNLAGVGVALGLGLAIYQRKQTSVTLLYALAFGFAGAYIGNKIEK